MARSEAGAAADAGTGAAIERIRLHRLSAPLKRPYRLSFRDLVAFDTLLVELVDADGRSGFGEATFLPGYGEESLDDQWPLACALADEAVGGSPAALEEALARRFAQTPFTATAFRTALDLLQGAAPLTAGSALRVPLLALLNADDEASTPAEVDALLAAGYRTFKVKAGLAGGDDLRRIGWIQRIVDGRARLRIDANQAYTAEQAVQVLAAIDPTGIELFEQPCGADDWAGHARAVARSRVPLMLDEAIYGLDDVDRAARDRLAAFIKVKLVKFTSLRALGEAVDRVRSHGIGIVSGNGVACDVGCWMEAALAADRGIDTAGEMNGWLKLRTPLLADPPRLEQGHLVTPAGWTPRLDDKAVAQQRLALHEARAGTGAAAPRRHTGPLEKETDE